MIYAIRAVPILLLAIGCTPPPPAELKLRDVIDHSYHYDVYFDSNIDLLSIPSGNRYQKPFSTNLICSVADTQDFSPEQDLENPASGIVNLVSVQESGARGKYLFKAHLVFSHIVPDTTQAKSISSNSEVEELLASHTRIACKVRTLLYYGPAYYSNMIHISVDHVKELASKTALEERKFDLQEYRQRKRHP
ncbi:hypothetical protein [Pseudoduganella lutea]|uniref:Lipoprotein n=1 Tax=Pseudoduganella lutea TaxID=321985 RepID=A0A4P6L4U8_9BURK|nr:hypothetical protein [Pseudoduganella lutea]QBE65928.1 hypothetical protein EWM63_25515 [Pseudoduganella lutea]